MKRLQDIADQVGVSRTTVSNVLHGNTKKVSKEMIRKISEILNQEGYVPDTSSRELTRKGSCIIGLVLGYSCIHGIPSLRDTFVAEFLSGVEETAHRNGYYIMLINVTTPTTTDLDAFLRLLQKFGRTQTHVVLLKIFSRDYDLDTI